MTREHYLLEYLFKSGIDTVRPDLAVNRCVRISDNSLHICGRVYDLNAFEKIELLGAGLQVGAMAREVEEILGDRLSGGDIIVGEGQGLDLKRVACHEASLPLPSGEAFAASENILARLRAGNEKTLFIVLISDGASSLLCAPSQLPLSDSRQTIRLLLEKGASTAQVACVRKHLSRLKGGLLARRAAPAHLECLAVSDLPEDVPGLVGAGPTLPDPTTFADALEVLYAHGLEDKVPASVLRRLTLGKAGRLPETPKPGDPVFARCHTTVIAGMRRMLSAITEKAATMGLEVRQLPAISGSARITAWELSHLASIAATGLNGDRPILFLTGGQTTTVQSDGSRKWKHTDKKNERNQELALALASAFQGNMRLSALCAGTTGLNGSAETAGAFVDGATVTSGHGQGLDARDFLARNDSHAFFQKVGGLFTTGPTRTNVADLAMVLIGKADKINFL